MSEITVDPFAELGHKCNIQDRVTAIESLVGQLGTDIPPEAHYLELGKCVLTRLHLRTYVQTVGGCKGMLADSDGEPICRYASSLKATSSPIDSLPKETVIEKGKTHPLANGVESKVITPGTYL